MYICICSAVNERQIALAVNEGATKLKDLRRSLGIANDCGRCAPCVKQCLKNALDQHCKRTDFQENLVAA